MRVDRERAREAPPRRCVAAEAALGHPEVERLEGVPGPEAQRVPGVRLGLAAAAVADQPPGEDVLRGDARGEPVRAAGAREGVAESPSVVEVEVRRLELGLNPVRPEDPLDR